MIEDISLERAGGQLLIDRLTALNACALGAARRMALNPNGAARIRLAPESLSSYRDLSEMEIAHFASQPIFLFRPSSLAEALSQPQASSPPPDGELVRRFAMVLRDLARHAIASPAVILGLEPSDIQKSRRLTDDDIEALQRSQGLTFSPRIAPTAQLRSSTADGWDQDQFLSELLRDLGRQLAKSRQSVPKGLSRP